MHGDRGIGALVKVQRRCPVVVGRSTEESRVVEALASDDAGIAVVAVAGEAGIGKSRLVEDVLDQVAGHVVIRWCRCHLADTMLPFGPFIDLATTDRALGRLADVLGTTGAGGGDGEGADLRRRLAFDEIGRSVLDQERPTVLVVEDLHWADDLSLQALGHLTRHVESSPHRLVVTYRPREQSPTLVGFLAEVDRRRILDVVELAPLPGEAVAALAEAMTGAELGDEQRRRLTELSDGNPFHVEELLRATGGDLLSSTVPIPRTVEHSVTARLATLDPVTRQAAARAAIIGRDVPVDQFTALMGWDADEMARRAGDLVSAGLLADVDGERLRFVHELARRAVESELLAMEREAIHRELVEFLVARARVGAGIDERTRADIARHAYEGRDWPTAIEHGTAAAEAALGRWSADAALAHLDRVVAASERSATPVRSGTYLLRARARRLVGRHGEARDDLLAAVLDATTTGDLAAAWEAHYELAMLDLQDSHARGAAELEVALETARTWGDEAAIARTLNRQGNLAANRLSGSEAIALLDEAMCHATASDDDRVVAETGVLLLVAHLLRGDVPAGRRSGAQAVERLRRLDDPVGLVQALFSMSVAVAEHACTDHGPPAATVATCEGEAREALAIATSLGWTAGEALAQRAVGGVLAAADRPAEALEHLRASERAAASIGHATHLLRAKVMLADALFDIGDTHGARRTFEQTIELGAPIGAIAPLLPSHLRLVEIDLLEGRVDDAIARLDTVMDRVGDADVPFTPVATIQVATARGDLERAVRMAEEALAGQDAPAPRLGELHGELLARLGRHEEAATVLGRADRRAVELGLRQRRRWIMATRARVASMAGDRAGASRFCDEAWVMTDAAAVGLDPEQVALLRADMERRTSGVPRSGGHLPDDHGGPGALTRREREVALVLARGLTNQQVADELFISVRTAETHVKRILSKLGFTSRGQVARWVHDQQLDRP